jgi:hypothetical protein
LWRAVVIGFRSSFWTRAFFSGILFNHNDPVLVLLEIFGAAGGEELCQVCNELCRRML